MLTSTCVLLVVADNEAYEVMLTGTSSLGDSCIGLELLRGMVFNTRSYDLHVQYNTII